MKEKVFRNAQVRKMRKRIEIQRAKELRVDEVSVHNGESHETFQQVTSLLHEMQEQMNPFNVPGEFREVESNYVCRTSSVSCQFAMLPSSRSVLSRDKILLLDTCNTSGLQESVFLAIFKMF